MKKYSLDDFIERSNKIHNNKYDYSLVEYTGSKVKVVIICPKHGVFSQLPYSHIAGKGCPECSNKKPYTTESFITKAKQVHGDRYDYSMVEYINNCTKIKIICPKHGVFSQMPKNHILHKHGCPSCCGLKKLNNKTFIERSNSIHNNRYDYSLVEYVNCYSKVKIVCSIHGVFEQRAQDHLQGHGCSKCINTISKQEIILLNYIKSLYDGEIITNTRSVIPPYEIDVYLPNKQLAFEYNGTYWHTEGVTKPVGYHQMKTDMCIAKGVELHHIWESDWVGDNINTKDKIMGVITNKNK